MTKVINALNKMKLTFTPDSTFPRLPRMIIGSVICGQGDTYKLAGANFLPDLCTIIVDARYLPERLPHEVIEEVMKKLKTEGRGLDYEIRVSPDDPELPGVP